MIMIQQIGKDKTEKTMNWEGETKSPNITLGFHELPDYFSLYVLHMLVGILIKITDASKISNMNGKNMENPSLSLFLFLS